MKKILASIILLLAFVHHSNAQTVAPDFDNSSDYGTDLDVTATAVVIIPLAANKVKDLRFGNLATSASGTLIMKAQSATERSTGGGVIALNTDVADVGPGEIEISGNSEFTFKIFVDTSVELATAVTATVDDVTEMTVNDIKISTTATAIALTTSATKIFIGGTLNVVDKQAPGTYTGNINIYVQYE